MEVYLSQVISRAPDWPPFCEWQGEQIWLLLIPRVKEALSNWRSDPWCPRCYEGNNLTLLTYPWLAFGAFMVPRSVSYLLEPKE
jgi:hypothetical protein